jgi:RNA polymerase sigma-70 factor (ECF subfamily)
VEHNNQDNKVEAYVQLLTEHERYLCGYVYKMIPNSADAEDVLQDIKMAIWKEFDRFELGTNFGAWSRKVAFHRVMAFRKKKAIEGKRLTFSDACVEFLADQPCHEPDVVHSMARKLSGCLSKLKGPQKELLVLRYNEAFSIEEIALKTGKTVAASYRGLSRARGALRDCLKG